MSYSIVGEQIQKFRKDIGFTQRELGEAIGVSSSAVSQWESGGTPDVSLLPAIADKLHVTIDALFGREGSEVVDMKETIDRWAKALPEGQRLDQVCQIAFIMLKAISFPILAQSGVEYTKTCELVREEGDKILLPSVIYTDEGIATGVFADDMAFTAVFPEPEAGYGAYFAPAEKYREFFKTLAEPGVLEVICSLAAEPRKHFTPGAVAKRAGISEPEVKAALDLLVELHMAKTLDLESDVGEISAYELCKQYDLVPLLYIVRILMEPEGYYLGWITRKSPLLRSKNKYMKGKPSS